MAIAHPAAPGPRRAAALRRYFWFVAPAVILGGAVVAHAAGFGFLQSLLGVLLLVQCAYPAVRYIHERDPIVPAVPILAAAYALQFALPVFIGDGTIYLIGGFHDIDPDDLLVALVIANLAMATFLFVVYNRVIGQLVDTLPRIRLQLNRTRAVIYSLLFGVLVGLGSGLFATLSAETQTLLSAIFRIFQTQMLIAIGVLAWLSYTSRSIWMKLLYWAFVATAVVEGLSRGYIEAAAAPIAIVFACEWIYRHRLSKRMIGGMVLLMLLLNPVKSHYREMVWFGSGPEVTASRIDKALFWVEAGIAHWGSVLRGESRGEDAALELVKRASMIDLLAHVHDTTPESIPYFKGETYSYFAYSLIPRILWPEKPVASANQTLAVAYGLTTIEGAERSTFGVSLLGEGYANFGWLGSIGIMAILGLVLRSLQIMFTTAESGPGGYALFLAFFIFFLNGLGSSAEILLGNLLQSLVVSSILMYWVSERPRPRA